MEALWRQLKHCLEEKQDTMLVVVTEGSEGIPGKVGAKMLVGAHGRIAGTVGGGNIEFQVILSACKLLKARQHGQESYQLQLEKPNNLGMVCGGSTKLLFYFLDGESECNKELVETGLCMYEKKIPHWLAIPYPDTDSVICIGETQTVDVNAYYTEQFLQEGKVYIFGGGHVARELVPVLAKVGFRCIVADDRREYTAKEDFLEAEETRLVDYEHLEETIHIEEKDYVVLMTRGHQWDLECERFALHTEAHYIGVMGSKKKAKYIREILLKEGYSEETLSRVTTPVGLEIGSETPEEIAISIAAQLIQHRANTRKNSLR